jgi:hypothetical protein
MDLHTTIKAGVILGLILFIFPTTAQAYLDPGTGSYILQLLAAGIFAGLFAVKIFWQKIRSFFSSLFSKNEKENIK